MADLDYGNMHKTLFHVRITQFTAAPATRGVQ